MAIDHKRKLYFFESAVSPNTFWIDLKDINFSGTQTLKLDLGKDQSNIYAGKANGYLKATTAFKFLGIS